MQVRFPYLADLRMLICVDLCESVVHLKGWKRLSHRFALRLTLEG